jgi:hypothetical protein
MKAAQRRGVSWLFRLLRQRGIEAYWVATLWLQQQDTHRDSVTVIYCSTVETRHEGVMFGYREFAAVLPILSRIDSFDSIVGARVHSYWSS